MKSGLRTILLCCCFLLISSRVGYGIPFFGGQKPKTVVRVSVLYNDGKPVEDQKVEVTVSANKTFAAKREKENRGPFFVELKGYQGKLKVLVKAKATGLKPPIVEKELLGFRVLHKNLHHSVSPSPFLIHFNHNLIIKWTSTPRAKFPG